MISFNTGSWLRGTTACRIADLDAAQLIRACIIGRLHIVDVRRSDPGEFRFDPVGYGAPFQAPRAPGAHPIAIYADGTLRDYNSVRLTAAPRLQRLRARLDSVGYHYKRLILPLLDTRRRVSHLAVAIEPGPGDGVPIAPAPSRLLQRLQVGDDIVDLGRLEGALERHPVALHLGLRIGDVLLEVRLGPGDIAGAHRAGIAEILDRG
jgi:hypothetical protein